MTHPPKEELAEQQWRQEITKLANDTEAAVNLIMSKAPLSEVAAYLGRWLSEHAEDGWQDIFDGDEIAAQIPGATEIEIVEALGELELEGMIKISATLASSTGRVIAYPKLYEVFDPIVFEGVSPREDAATIAEAILATRDTASMSEVADAGGWPTRRANPAISIVGQMIGAGRKSSPIGVGYCILYITADAGERVLLRRFVEDVRGPSV